MWYSEGGAEHVKVLSEAHVKVLSEAHVKVLSEAHVKVLSEAHEKVLSEAHENEFKKSLKSTPPAPTMNHKTHRMHYFQAAIYIQRKYQGEAIAKTIRALYHEIRFPNHYQL